LDYLARHLPQELNANDRVRLLVGHADDFSAIPAGEHDLVVLNSVVQYFPSAEYLHSVLTGAVRSVASGAVFIGDVRSLALLETFAVSVELAHAEDDHSLTDLRERVARRLLLEQELAVAPEFFHALRAELPQIRSVEVLPKRGHHVTELTSFRYDVILHVGPMVAETEPPPTRLTWASDTPTLDALRRRLQRAGETDVYVADIPNARVERDVRARALMATLDATSTVSDLRQRLGEASRGVSPEEVAAIGESLGLEAELHSAASGDLARVDVVFHRPGRSRRAPLGIESPPAVVASTSHYTNNPLRGVFVRTMVPRIRAFLGDRLPAHLVPSQYVLLDQLPLTVSGKVDRARLPAPDRARPDLGVEYVAPTLEVERTLARIWCEVLGVNRVGIHDNFFELGGDSILGIQIIARARSVGLTLSPRHLFEHQTLAELVHVVVEEAPLEVEQGLVTGAVPLTPIQRWFFERDFEDPRHVNQTLMIRSLEPLAIEPVRCAVRDIVAHHDAFRHRFAHEGGTWRQTCELPRDEVPVSYVDLSAVSASTREATIREVIAEAQSTLDLANGPVVSFQVIDCGPGEPGRLLVTAHHLVIDTVSWRILLDDFRQAYEQALHGASVTLPTKTMSFKRWSELLEEHAQSPAIDAERAYWRAASAEADDAFPIDHDSGPNTSESTSSVTARLGADETAALMRPPAGRAAPEVEEVLLAALVHAVARIWQQSRLLVDVQRDGRDRVFPGVDFSRTIGCFITTVPTRLVLQPHAPVEQTLAGVREQLRAVPGRGVGYGLLRFATPATDETRALAGLSRAPIAFAYLGEGGARDDESTLDSSLTCGPVNSRPYLIEISARVSSGRLVADFRYSRNRHHLATMTELAEAFATALHELISSGRSEKRDYVAADFKHARLSEGDFAKLMDRLGAGGRRSRTS
jgi:non-ribosomal peptide synthase protein (TIGR01720 family)